MTLAHLAQGGALRAALGARPARPRKEATMPIRPENRARYPKDWAQISQHIRFGRAAGRCECHGECGRGTHAGRCPNLHGGQAYGTGSEVVLTTAHLDHTPENCDPANLRAMCQGCHLHYDKDHHRETAAATRRAAVEQAGQLALLPEQPALAQPATVGPPCGNNPRYQLSPEDQAAIDNFKAHLKQRAAERTNR